MMRSRNRMSQSFLALVVKSWQWERFYVTCPSPRQRIQCGWPSTTRKATQQGNKNLSYKVTSKVNILIFYVLDRGKKKVLNYTKSDRQDTKEVEGEGGSAVDCIPDATRQRRNWGGNRTTQHYIYTSRSQHEMGQREHVWLDGHC